MRMLFARSFLCIVAVISIAAKPDTDAFAQRPQVARAYRAPATGLHLYVASYKGAGSVARYPLVGGKPASQPDFVYHGVTAPIAVGVDGTLYASSNLCLTCYARISVWPPGESAPTGYVTLPSTGLEGTQPLGLAVSPAGFFFVAYDATISGRDLSDGARTSQLTKLPLNGIFVYNRNRLGGPPIEAYDVPLDASGPSALAIDPVSPHDLYATVSDDSGMGYIETIADPQGRPRFVRRVQLGDTFFPASGGSLVFDENARNLYELVYRSTEQEDVIVLRHNADGPVKVIRKIVLYGPRALGFRASPSWGVARLRSSFRKVRDRI